MTQKEVNNLSQHKRAILIKQLLIAGGKSFQIQIDGLPVHIQCAFNLRSDLASVECGQVATYIKSYVSKERA